MGREKNVNCNDITSLESSDSPWISGTCQDRVGVPVPAIVLCLQYGTESKDAAELINTVTQ